MARSRSFRSSKSFGERCEYAVIAELLKRNFDVYKTLVDDQHIDCIVRISSKKYLDIQIKARSKRIKKSSFAYFPGMMLKPRENFFYIFYSEALDKYWVFPTKKLIMFAKRLKHGKSKGKYYIRLSAKTKNGTPKYEKYENAFYLLK